MAQNLTESTIDTLGSKDSFAVITFNDKVNYFSEDNVTFLWEGTNINKNEAIKYLKNISLGAENKYFEAFNKTFEKLNQEKIGRSCSKEIILILMSDGIFNNT